MTNMRMGSEVAQPSNLEGLWQENSAYVVPLLLSRNVRLTLLLWNGPVLLLYTSGSFLDVDNGYPTSRVQVHYDPQVVLP